MTEASMLVLLVDFAAILVYFYIRPSKQDEWDPSRAVNAYFTINSIIFWGLILLCYFRLAAAIDWYFR